MRGSKNHLLVQPLRHAGVESHGEIRCKTLTKAIHPGARTSAPDHRLRVRIETQIVNFSRKRTASWVREPPDAQHRCAVASPHHAERPTPHTKENARRRVRRPASRRQRSRNGFPAADWSSPASSLSSATALQRGASPTTGPCPDPRRSTPGRRTGHRSRTLHPSPPGDCWAT